MNTTIINEQQLQAEVDTLKTQFAETKDIYREVCVLLFFRYGITPTANKLYQYVRRGSMSAPADALNKFWLELREKSRVRIERPDIPENIAAAAGDLIAYLWNEAQKAAQSGFSELIDNAATEILKYRLQSEVAEQKSEENRQLLTETQAELKNALKRLSETENLRQVDTLTLADNEKSLKTLQNEKSSLLEQINALKASFSKDVSLINDTQLKSEARYDSLERKLLLEIDQARNSNKRIDQELSTVKKLKAQSDQMHKKEIDKLHNTINSLRELVGVTKGKLASLEKQLRKSNKTKN